MKKINLSLIGFSLLFSFSLFAQSTLPQSSNYTKVPDNIWLNYDAKVLEGESLKQYYSIINNLRCPVCQGQSIAESDSQIALDLKSMVYQKINQGYSEDEIKKLLIDRYGYYINFEPPVDKSTLPLWFFPFIIALFGVLFVLYRTRTNRKFEKWK